MLDRHTAGESKQAKEIRLKVYLLLEIIKNLKQGILNSNLYGRRKPTEQIIVETSSEPRKKRTYKEIEKLNFAQSFL